MKIKRKLRNCVESMLAKQISTDILDEYSVISCDVFDTLVCRTVSVPEAVFAVAERIYENETGIKVQFVSQRQLAEKRSRKKTKREITLEDIYCYIQNKDIDLEVMKKCELKAEEQVIIPNKEIVSFLNYAKKRHIKVFLISDMYLDKKFITDVLDGIGIKCYDEIIVSSNLGITKRNTKLFRWFIKNRLNGCTSGWCHIGDNFLSDYVNVKRVNGVAYLYKRK